MRNSEFAESLLSLVTSQDRAASIAGDFTESSRGVLWFWSSVLRAGFSLLWKEVAASPARMATLVVGGIALQIAFFVPFLACIFATVIPVRVIALSLQIGTYRLISLFLDLMVCTMAIAAPFLAGRWMARRAPGQELAPCLALSVLTTVVWSVSFLIWREEIGLMNAALIAPIWPGRANWDTLRGISGVVPAIFCVFAANISLYAGAIRVRSATGENHA